MDYKAHIRDYIAREKEILDMLDVEAIDAALNKIVETFENEGTIYIFGNGGSASTASHFANDFNKGISEYTEKKFRFICLNDNVHIRNYDIVMQNLHDAFQSILPEKSSFEL